MSMSAQSHSTGSAPEARTVVPEIAFPVSPAQVIMDNENNDDEEVNISVSQTPRESKENLQAQLYKEYLEASKQVTVEDIGVNGDEKLKWLLGKLRLPQDQQDNLIKMLHDRDQEKGQDAEEALNMWKFVVITSWTQSEDYARIQGEDAERGRDKQPK